MSRVMVAMSGGVDSAVAAFLSKEAGHEVVGAIMRIWSGEGCSGSGHGASCYGPEEEQDIADAGEVARKLGIPLHIVDLREEFRGKVINHVYREYLMGRTPNPCVVCNRKLKFEDLPGKVEQKFGAEFIATGHYARVEYDDARNRYILKKAKDTRKDQSYFLFSLSQKQLQRCLFPVGAYTKAEVRKLAQRLGLGVEAKPESQDFVAGKYSTVLNMPSNPGLIIDTQGKVLGEHEGIHLYTIGQRKGIRISRGYPLYVVAINRERNALVVGEESELYHNEVEVAEVNWIAGEEERKHLEVEARIRYRHQEARALVYPLGDGRARVKFETQQRAIAPGQAMVFYDGDTVLGGGTIESVKN